MNALIKTGEAPPRVGWGKPFYFASMDAQGMRESALWAAVVGLAIYDCTRRVNNRFPMNAGEWASAPAFFQTGLYREVLAEIGIDADAFDKILNRDFPWVPLPGRENG